MTVNRWQVCSAATSSSTHALLHNAHCLHVPWYTQLLSTSCTCDMPRRHGCSFSTFRLLHAYVLHMHDTEAGCQTASADVLRLLHNLPDCC